MNRPKGYFYNCSLYALSLLFLSQFWICCSYSPSKTVSYSSIKNSDTIPPKIIIVSPIIDSNRGIVIAKSTNDIFIKGVVVDENIIDKFTINNKEVSVNNDGSFSYNASVGKGINKFNLVAVDRNNNQTQKTITVMGEDQEQTSLQLVQTYKSISKPVLWVLTIGVSKYKNQQINLEFADNDAIAIADTLKTSKYHGIFSEIISKTLVNEEATRGNILTAMSQHLGRAAPNDVVLIFVAGHGVKNVQTGSYYFLPYNADSHNLLYEGLKWSDFDESIKIISTNVNKVILILDTCHSGAINVAMRNLNAGEDLAATMKAASGLYVLSASKGGETSIEGNQYIFPGEKRGHGAFTYAFLKGLKGEANYDNNSYLTINEIFSYVSSQVPRLTNGSQHPYSKIEGTDLPLVFFK